MMSYLVVLFLLGIVHLLLAPLLIHPLFRIFAKSIGSGCVIGALTGLGIWLYLSFALPPFHPVWWW